MIVTFRELNVSVCNKFFFSIINIQNIKLENIFIFSYRYLVTIKIKLCYLESVALEHLEGPNNIGTFVN